MQHECEPAHRRGHRHEPKRRHRQLHGSLKRFGIQVPRLCNRRETGVRRRYVRGQITGAYCNTVLVPTRLAVAPRGVGPPLYWALLSARCRAPPGSSLGCITRARLDHHEPITPTHRQCGLGARDFGAPTVDITCLTRPKVADDERCSDRRLSAPPNLKNFSCQSHPFFSVDRPLLCSRVVLCATRARASVSSPVHNC